MYQRPRQRYILNWCTFSNQAHVTCYKPKISNHSSWASLSTCRARRFAQAERPWCYQLSLCYVLHWGNRQHNRACVMRYGWYHTHSYSRRVLMHVMWESKANCFLLSVTPKEPSLPTGSKTDKPIRQVGIRWTAASYSPPKHALIQ